MNLDESADLLTIQMQIILVVTEAERGIRMNLTERLQINKELEIVTKKQIKNAQKRTELSEELEKDLENKVIKSMINELEEENKKLNEKSIALITRL